MAWVLLNKYGLLGSAKLIWTDVLFDLRHGLDTARPVSISRLFDADNAQDKNRYVPSTFAAIDSALAFLQRNRTELADYSLCNFVDLGSGKGKALIAASHWPFRSLVGIEMSPLLHQIAQSNIATLKLSGRIELRSSDASQLHCDESDKVFYLFNPFTGQTLEDCLSAIAVAGQQSRRYIIYVNPTEDDTYSRYFKLIDRKVFEPGAVAINFYETF